MPFKYVFSCLHLQICQLCEIPDLAMHWTDMLLNWIHPTFDWLCIEPLYTVQVLTEGATAWELMDQMPPLAGSNRGYHGSMTLSDAFFGQYPCPYFTVSCQDQRSQAVYYVGRAYPLGRTSETMTLSPRGEPDRRWAGLHLSDLLPLNEHEIVLIEIGPR